MRITVVLLILTILVCAMVQESEQIFWGGRRYRYGRRYRGCCCRTTPAPTNSTNSTAGNIGRKRREIIDTIPLEINDLE
ncbi:PREDICTED: uncharacterized protein LOC105452983 [Wasmannia auropunctata]|uniref:uncharacterized protein LOC105452983 n=1 Tax=Wasmannia auropunctata TaxID=64793 RepID=UPI0005F0BF6E|nr:PREDICTED: uncharacterized protein LOC105452983 [Wasmannia auropunctata]